MNDRYSKIANISYVLLKPFSFLRFLFFVIFLFLFALVRMLEKNV